MEISITSRFITMNHKYRVNWGVSGRKFFNKRSAAVRFKNSLVNKYKKLGYTIDYMYIAD